MGSAVDGAVTALVDLLRASDDLAGVTVHDGPPTVSETPDWIAVGYQPGSAEAVDVTYDWAQIGAMTQEERITIRCSLACSSGDEPMGARRTRAVALRDAVASVIRANSRLNDTVRVAHMTSATLMQEQTPQGAMAGYAFTVEATVRISS